MLSNLKIKYKLLLLVSIFITCFLLFSFIAFRTVTQIKISGKLYNDIISGKDLIADILPPPEYIIETNLTAYELLNETDKNKIEVLIKYEQHLKADFESRHGVWERNLPISDIKKVLIEDSYKPAVQFFKILNDEFIPAIRNGDKEKARQIMVLKLDNLYLDHRHYIDKVVKLAAEQNSAIEKSAKKTITSDILLLVLIIGTILIITITLCFIIIRIITNPLAMLTDHIKIVAAGNFTVPIPDKYLQAKDELGEIAKATDEMQHSIKSIINKLNIMNQIMLSKTRNAIVVTDANGKLVDFNEYAQKILGFKKKEVIGKFIYGLGVTGHLFEDVLNNHKSYENLEVEFKNNNDEEYICLVDVQPIHDENLNIIGAFGQFRNITDRILAEDQIRHYVYYDALTELFNRKKMREDVEILLVNKIENFAFLFVDLDKFKSVNDNYGHQAGDYILKTVAIRLKSITKSTDTIYRIGGDEFIVILRKLKAIADAQKIAVTISETLSAPFNYKENKLFIGASIGISIFPQHGIDEDTLSKKADLAMYDIKRKGGNGYKVYSSEIKKEDSYKLNI